MKKEGKNDSGTSSPELHLPCFLDGTLKHPLFVRGKLLELDPSTALNTIGHAFRILPNT